MTTTEGNGMDITTELVQVDLACAERLIASNYEYNRPIRWDRVHTFARDMVEGRWHQGVSTVKLDTEGRMIDGQHRVWAVVEAAKMWAERHPGGEICVPMEITSGIDPSAIQVIDTGRARDLADVIRINGKSGINPTWLKSAAAVARWSVMWENGNPMQRGGLWTPSHTESHAYYLVLVREVMAGVKRGLDLHQAKVCGTTVAGVAYVRFTAIDEEQAHQFFDRLADGVALSAEDPRLVLREKLKNSAGTYWANTRRSTRFEKLAWFVSAWNAWRQERPLTRIQGAKGGLTTENFPKPI